MPVVFQHFPTDWSEDLGGPPPRAHEKTARPSCCLGLIGFRLRDSGLSALHSLLKKSFTVEGGSYFCY